MSAATVPPRVRSGVLLGAALLLVTLNLRLPIGAVSPVLHDIRDDLGLSASAAGLLTTLPVLCFGLAAPLAPWLSRRMGQEAVLLLLLVVLLCGTAVRLVPSIAPLYLGTLVIGVAIAVGNVLMPSVIKRRFASPGVMMGVFTAGFSIAAGLATGLTVPLDDALGDWRWGIGAWGLVAVVAVAVWAPFALAAGRAPAVGGARAGRLRHDRVAWLVTGTFALQSFLFYAFLAWTPEILQDAGLSEGRAGAMVSIATICAIPASLYAPVLATRRSSQGLLALACSVTWLPGLFGLMFFADTLTPLWMLFLGVGQGVGVSYALTLVVLRAPDDAHAASLSSMAQGIGYVAAAPAPFVIGALHDATGGWDAGLVLLAVVAVALLWCGWVAGRPGMVGDP